MSNQGSTQPGAFTGETVDTTKAVIGLVTTLAGLFFPGSTLIAGFTLTELGNIAQGLASEAPAVVTAWNEVTNAINGGKAPTPEQLQALNDAADAANADLEAADEAVIKGGAAKP